MNGPLEGALGAQVVADAFHLVRGSRARRTRLTSGD
jgi:hypothetical protein